MKKFFASALKLFLSTVSHFGGDDAVIKGLIGYLAKRAKKDLELKTAIISFDNDKPLMAIAEDASGVTPNTTDDAYIEKVKEIKNGIKKLIKAIDSQSLKATLLDKFTINGVRLGDLKIPDFTPDNAEDNILVRTLIAWFIADVRNS